MFWQASVILSTGGCTPPGQTLPTPIPRQTPQAETLMADTPWADTPLPETATAEDGKYPTGMHSRHDYKFGFKLPVNYTTYL